MVWHDAELVAMITGGCALGGALSGVAKDFFMARLTRRNDFNVAKAQQIVSEKAQLWEEIHSLRKEMREQETACRAQMEGLNERIRGLERINSELQQCVSENELSIKILNQGKSGA